MVKLKSLAELDDKTLIKKYEQTEKLAQLYKRNGEKDLLMDANKILDQIDGELKRRFKQILN